MNKWVVAILMIMAFAAGGMSMYKMGQQSAVANGPAPPGTPSSPPSAIASQSPLAEATPVVARPTSVTAKEPHFGRPGKPVVNRKPETGSSKPGIVMGEISAHIFSTKPGGPAQTRFPKSAGDVYLTLTPVKMSESVELVASTRSAMSEGAGFGAPVQSSGPPRLRTFRFAPPEGGWIPGPYQVLVKPVGSEQVLLLSRFEIEKPDAPKPAACEPPEYLDLVSDPTADAPQSVFDTNDQQIYLIVPSKKPGIKIRSVWSAVEVDKLTPGELLAANEVSAPAPGQDASFSFTPPKGGFLPGSYRVDVYFDQQQVGSQAFFIQPAPEVADASATPTAIDSATP